MREFRIIPAVEYLPWISKRNNLGTKSAQTFYVTILIYARFVQHTAFIMFSNDRNRASVRITVQYAYISGMRTQKSVIVRWKIFPNDFGVRKSKGARKISAVQTYFETTFNKRTFNLTRPPSHLRIRFHSGQKFASGLISENCSGESEWVNFQWWHVYIEYEKNTSLLCTNVSLIQ